MLRRTAKPILHERTLKQVQGRSLDVCIDFGDGIRFHHYEEELREASSYFFNLLPVDEETYPPFKTTEDTGQTIIDFSDKDSECWPLVYSFIDKDNVENNSNGEHRRILKHVHKYFAVGSVPPLLLWFSYLGMDDLAYQADMTACCELPKANLRNGYSQLQSIWIDYKIIHGSLGDPNFLTEALFEEIEAYIFNNVMTLARNTAIPNVGTRAHILFFLQCDYIGEHVWDYLCSIVPFPRDMLARLTREEIITSNTFFDILLLASQQLGKKDQPIEIDSN